MGAVTVRVVFPLTAPEAAVMVVDPGPPATAPPVALIVATVVFEELHMTEVVRSAVLLSLYVPVAVNCRPVPRATIELAGVTAMDTNCAGFTVNVVDAETDPMVAVIVVEPMPELAANPCEPVLLLITATIADELVQVTFVVMSFVL
jgi:hypothetical protein